MEPVHGQHLARPLDRPAVAPQAARARAAADRLADALEAVDFRGWDAYDALASPVLDRIARGRLARTTAIQLFKRSPVNLRGLVRTPKEHHTKAIALAVSAYSHLAGTAGGERYARTLPRLADLLIRKSTRGEDTAAWSYEFHVQTRWGEYRAGKPNAVATAFAGHALLDATAVEARPEYEELARGAVRFACRELLVERDGERYFGYHAGHPTPIHNSSMLLAGLAARCAPPDSEERGLAADAVSYTLARQRPDGSWPYGEGRRLEWVDGFHTAYVLNSLMQWHEATGDAAAREPLERGLALYIERLIDADGAARDTLESRYPVDIHACATAISSLALLGGYDPRGFDTATRVLEWTLANMSRRDGRFAFRRHRLYRNSLPYIRWGDAHMLHGLAVYAAEAARR